MFQMLAVLALVFSGALAYNKPCSDFGYNWAAEIRCLRSMLSQCEESPMLSAHREARTIDAHNMHGRYPMYPRIPTTAAPTAAPFDMDAIYRNLTQHLERRVAQLKDRLEQDMGRKLSEIQSKFENEMRLMEARLERKITDNQRQCDLDIKRLSKRIDMQSARIYHNGQNEYIVVQDRESWYRAEEICLQWGGHLASVEDAQENAFLESLLHGESAWIGFNDVQLENAYVNTDRSNTSYRNWLAGQPDNVNHNENCVELGRGGQWSDILCLLRRPFFCKR